MKAESLAIIEHLWTLAHITNSLELHRLTIHSARCKYIAVTWSQEFGIYCCFIVTLKSLLMNYIVLMLCGC
jgi:hypothetical protein